MDENVPLPRLERVILVAGNGSVEQREGGRWVPGRMEYDLTPARSAAAGGALVVLGRLRGRIVRLFPDAGTAGAAVEICLLDEDAASALRARGFRISPDRRVACTPLTG